MEPLSPRDFEGLRLRRPGDVAVLFIATWCPFCRDFLPGFLAREATSKFRLAVADISEYSNPLWDTFSIEIVPTIVAFHDGQVLWRRDGKSGYGLDDTDLHVLGAPPGDASVRGGRPKGAA
jgi:thioredoxin